MSLSQYALGGTALAVAIAVGYASWTARGAKVDKAEAKTAIAQAECTTITAADINKNLLQRVTSLTADVERQKRIGLAHEKKSLERLKQFNDLQRKIANVPQSQNVPVSDHLERVLDELRRPVAGSGGPAADRPDADTGGDDAGPDGSGVPADPVPAS